MENSNDDSMKKCNPTELRKTSSVEDGIIKDLKCCSAPGWHPILMELHNGHFGVSKMKMLAWPRISHYGLGEAVWLVLRKSKASSLSLSTPMGIIWQAMGTSTCGLCRALSGFHVFNHGTYTLQMIGDALQEFHDLSQATINKLR